MRAICLVALLALSAAGCASAAGTPVTTDSMSGEVSQDPGGVSASGMRTFNESGLVFDYPASWREFHGQSVSSFSSLIAYLGTVPVDASCSSKPSNGGVETTCGEHFQLVSNSLAVAVRANGFPNFSVLNVPAGALSMVIGGLPGYQEVGPSPPGDPSGAETVVTTTIAHPALIDNYYTITASLRGPDVAPMRTQLDALIASLRFDPPVVPLPAGKDAAAAAGTRALTILRRDTPSWGCFVAIGVSRMVVDAVPMGPTLAHPQLATCTSTMEATPLQLWRMTMTMRFSESDPNVGGGQQYEVWVDADGNPGLTSGGPIDGP